MAVVSFSKTDIWLVARWAFERLFEDINKKYSIDPQIQFEFEQAVALDGLHFELMESEEIKEKILKMMKETIKELIADSSELLRRNLDAKGYKMYRDALPELLGYIERVK